MKHLGKEDGGEGKWGREDKEKALSTLNISLRSIWQNSWGSLLSSFYWWRTCLHGWIETFLIQGIYFSHCSIFFMKKCSDRLSSCLRISMNFSSTTASFQAVLLGKVGCSSKWAEVIYLWEVECTWRFFQVCPWVKQECEPRVFLNSYGGFPARCKGK